MINFISSGKNVLYLLFCPVGIGITGCNHIMHDLGMDNKMKKEMKKEMKKLKKKIKTLIKRNETSSRELSEQRDETSSRELSEQRDETSSRELSEQIVPIEQYLFPASSTKIARLIYKEPKNANDIKEIFIESNRFLAKPLYAPNPTKDFATYDPEIQKLYKRTLGDAQVMQKYGLGRPYTEEEFMELVNEHSRRWECEYPFAGFIVTNKETKDVVGYQVLAEFDIIVNSKEVPNKKNTGSVAICYDSAYHRSDTIQNVGYECIGALCLVYGQHLFNEREYINKKYSEKTKKYEGGEPFCKLEFSSKDNNASSKIANTYALKGDCHRIGKVHRYGQERVLFKKEYLPLTDKINVYSLTSNELKVIPKKTDQPQENKENIKPGETDRPQAA